MRILLLAGVLLAFGAPSAGAITGGEPATETYPWMASLREDGQHICGASLVAPDTVLTAAHCVAGETPGHLSVVLGRATLSGTGGETIAAKSIDVDEDYASDPLGGHDIALVRLVRPSKAQTLPIVGLDQTALWAPGAPVRVIGWGTATFAIGDVQDQLQQTDIEMISDPDCAASYDPPLGGGFDPDTMVCAGKRVVGLKDACQGDSGGPLVAKGPDGYVEVGTVSFGLGCGLPLLYGVYGRIGAPTLHGWLDQHLGSPDGEAPQVLATPSAVRVAVRHARIRGRRLEVRVRATAPVRGLRLTVLRRGKVLGRQRLTRLVGAAPVPIRLRHPVRGRVHVRVRAKDAGGAIVAERRSVRIRRAG